MEAGGGTITRRSCLLLQLILVVLAVTHVSAEMMTSTESPMDETTSYTTSTEMPTTTTPAPVGENLVPYGVAQGDNKIYGSDDSSTRTTFPREFTLFGNTFKDLFININGYISFGRDFRSYTPNFDEAYRRRATIVAGLWMDLDTSGSFKYTNGVIYYQHYEFRCRDNIEGEHGEELYTEVESIIRDAGHLGFRPHAISVFTWFNVTFSPYQDNMNEHVTFQIVLAMDYARQQSFMILLYQEIRASPTRPNRQGYVTRDNERSELVTSGRTSYVQLPYLNGGRFVFRTSHPWLELTSTSPTASCLDWYCTQRSQASRLQQADRWLPDCPCTFLGARFDRSWSVDWRTRCALTPFTFGTIARQCCYQQSFGSWWLWWWPEMLITSRTVDAGSLVSYHPWFQLSLHIALDRSPKQWCCDPRVGLCDLYYDVRPHSDCSRYRPPRITWMWGDPHVVTMDGKRYTYQGMGEYWLIMSDALGMQGRTQRAVDKDGKTLSATVWSAIAIRDAYSSNSDSMTSAITIQVKSVNEELDIYVQERAESLTSWYKNAEVNETNIMNRVTFTKLSDTKLGIQLPSGTGVDVEVGVKQLIFTVTYPTVRLQNVINATGLLGTPNNDTSDDFTLRDGTVLDEGISCEDIRDKFGDTWLIRREESLFYYNNGESYDTYTTPAGYVATCVDPATHPYGSIEEEAQAKETCGDDEFCLIDLILTKDTDLAKATTSTAVEKGDDQNTLNTEIPVITGPTNLPVQVNSTSTLTVSSNSTKAVTLSALFTMPNGATFDHRTGVFIWTVTDHAMEPITLGFGGQDADNTSAVPLYVTVDFCNCTADKGSCEDVEPVIVEQYFRVQTCVCKVFYEGPLCEVNFDACARDAICSLNATCEDVPLDVHLLHPDGPSETCEGCDDGYEIFIDGSRNNRTKCIDIDECMDRAPCEQKCVNIAGSYECTCYEGYTKLNDTHCADLDECQLQTDSCDHFCQNTDGNYTCSCRKGYALSPIGDGSCEPDASTEAECNTLGCAHDCADEYGNGTYTCFCNRGYQPGQTNQTTCEDIDECSLPTSDPASASCDPNATCANTYGAYECVCNDGYVNASDGISCNACPELQWGPNCANLCTNCASVADCNAVSGCQKCEAGLEGPFCDQDVDECNGAHTCDILQSVCNNTLGGYTCPCLEGYVNTNSTHCEPVDDCAQTTGEPVCGDNGMCVDKHLGFDCTCDTGYTGVRCELNIDDCAPNPCNNSGKCLDLVNSYTCECGTNTYGTHCEYTDEDDCASSPCLNGGTCQDLISDYRCVCVAGTMGRRCEQRPSDNCNVTRVEGPINVTYDGTLKITNREYTSDLENSESEEYQTLATEIRGKMEIIYSCRVMNITPVFKEVHNVAFSPGSVVVSWVTVLASEVDENLLLDAITDNLDVFAGADLVVDEGSVETTLRPIDDSDHNLVLVVGLVSAVAVIIVVVFVAIAIVLCMRRKKAKNQGGRQHRSKWRRHDDDGDEDSRDSSGSLSGSSIMPRLSHRHWFSDSSIDNLMLSPAEKAHVAQAPRIPRPQIREAPLSGYQPSNIGWPALRHVANRNSTTGALAAQREYDGPPQTFMWTQE